MGPKKAVIEPRAGAKYEYKIVETQPRYLTTQAQGETKPQVEQMMDELGQEHWLLAEVVFAGSSYVYLCFVREVE